MIGTWTISAVYVVMKDWVESSIEHRMECHTVSNVMKYPSLYSVRCALDVYIHWSSDLEEVSIIELYFSFLSPEMRTPLITLESSISVDTSVYSGTPLFQPHEMKTPLCTVDRTPLFQHPEMRISVNSSIPTP